MLRMWQARWDEIRLAIDRLERSTEALFSSVRMNTNGDYYGLSNRMLIPFALGIVGQIQGFRSAHAAEIPSEAVKVLDELLGKGFSVTKEPSGLPGIGGLVVVLMTIRAEFEPYVTDRELPGKRLVERAFAHLQRSIVADKDIGRKWRRAFSDGETACEALGGCHLLLHGIWAFKVSAARERTDLVLGDKLGIGSDIIGAAEAMALTEWKRAKTPGDATTLATTALHQASLYAAGSLAGFEIRSVRYLVLVTKDRVALPADVLAGGVTYRHINIAVEPATPSIGARTTTTPT